MGLSLALQPDVARAPDPDCDWLRGRTVVHKIVIGLIDPTASLLALLGEFSQTSGEIRSLTLKPTGGEHFEAIFQATALSPEAARALVGRIAAIDKVNTAAIEHVLIH